MSFFKYDLDHSTTADVDDTVRAYDFPPLPDQGESYIEGRVIAKGMIKHPVTGHDLFEGYVLALETRVCDGKTVPIADDEQGFVPYSTTLEWEGRVVLSS